MRKFIVVVLSFFASAVYAAPFQPITVAAGVTSCNVKVDGGVAVNVPATPPKPPTTTVPKCYFDLATYPVGVHNMTATAVITDPNWGTLEADPTGPFALTRPSKPSTPTFDGSIVPSIP
jgi:hypothetical protein